MKPSEIRKKLHKYVDEADSETLNFMKEALVLYKAQKQEEDKKGEDLPYPWAPTNEELLATVERAEENFRKGNYHLHEDVMAHIKSLNAKI